MIVFISTADGLWGAEMSLLSIAAGGNRMGVPVELWAASQEVRTEWKQRTGRNAKVVRWRKSRFARNLTAAVPLARVARGSTVISFDVDLLPIMWVLRPLWRVRGIRSVLDVHIMFTGRLTPRASRFLAGALDACMCVSDFVASQFTGRTACHVVWRPMAGRPTLRGKDFTSSERLTVGIVGRVDPEKRILEGLEALSNVSPLPRVVVRGAAFVGEEAYVDEVTIRGQELFGELFSFEGRVPAESALSGLDVLLHMNDREPSGRVIAEAQSQGVIALVPDRGGSCEFVVDGVTGLHFSPDRPESVSSRLKSVEDLERRREIAVSALEVARTSYDFDKQVIKYLEAASNSRIDSRNGLI